MYKLVNAFLLSAFLCCYVGIVAQTTIPNTGVCSLHLPIADYTCPPNQSFFSPTVFEFTVSNAPAGILGQTVFLEEADLIITHPWISDLTIWLESPQGKRILLAQEAGGGEDNMGIPDSTCLQPLTFSAAACHSIATGQAPFTDKAYAPMQSFSALYSGSTAGGNGTWKLIICDDALQDRGFLEHISLRFSTSSCPPLSSLRVVQADSTRATLEWDSQSGNCQPVLLEYGSSGFTPGLGNTAGQGTLLAAACSPYTLTGLPSGAALDIYVRYLCTSSNQYTANSCVQSFETACRRGAATAAFNFEEEALCAPSCQTLCAVSGAWKNAPLSPQWSVYRGDTPSPGTGPSSGARGSQQYVYLESSERDCQNAIAYLQSSCLQTSRTSNAGCDLSFWYHMDGPEVGYLALESTLNGGDSWQEIWRINGRQGSTWQEALIDLSMLPREATVQFRFKALAFGSRGDIGLDEIQFYGATLLPTNQVYYLDVDEDGFGQTNQTIRSCQPEAPAGYALLPGDCDDFNPTVNPQAAEFACNGVDDNCNNQVDESNALQNITVQGDTICNGQTAMLRVEEKPGSIVFWYESEQSVEPLATGETLFHPFFNSLVATPLDTFLYALVFVPECPSENRIPVPVRLLPTPKPVLTDTFCADERIPLSTIPLRDSRFLATDFSFHRAWPPDTLNRIPETETYPAKLPLYVQTASVNGCTTTDSLVIPVYPATNLSWNVPDTLRLCPKGKTTVRVSPGTLAYQWSTGDLGSSVDVVGKPLQSSPAGEWLTVQYTDTQGCRGRDSVWVQSEVGIDSFFVSVRPVSTCGGRDGQITLNPTVSGIGPWRLAWTEPSGQQQSFGPINSAFVLHNLVQGAYSFRISDSSPQGCSIETGPVLVGGPGATIRQTDYFSPACADRSDGMICIQTLGGNPVFAWSNGSTSACASGLAPGTYSVTVSDNGCETRLTNLVLQTPAALVTQVQKTRPTCEASVNGSLEIRVAGGSPPYQYRWENGSSQPNRTGLAPGVYAYTVTDQKGCAVTGKDSLKTADPLRMAVQIQAPSCHNSSDASIVTQVSGGSGLYSYRWNSGASTPRLSNLTPDTYRLTVTDTKGCTLDTTITIQAPAPLSLNTVPINPTCRQSNNGAINTQVSGGTLPYRFLWSDTLLNSPNRTALPTGTYALTVEDAKGCRVEKNNLLLASSKGFAYTATLQAPSCPGKKDGSIALQVNHALPYSAQWVVAGDSNFVVSVSGVGGLGAGQVSLQLTDTSLCRLDTLFVLRYTDSLRTLVSTTAPACQGASEGVITTNILGMQHPPYTYRWNNGSNSANLVGVSAGTYKLTITDGRLCQYTNDSIRVAAPAKLGIHITALRFPTCSGQQDGFLEFSPRGGKPPYRTILNGVQVSGNVVSDLKTGNLQIQVEDAAFCRFDTSIEVPALQALQLQLTQQGFDPCSPAISQLTASVSGGIAPYQFAWNTGQNQQTLVNPAKGEYRVTITDANGCRLVSSVQKIRQKVAPVQIDTIQVQPVGCQNANTGSALVNIRGGVPPFRYHFSNNEILLSESRSVRSSGLVAGDYQVTVTDVTNGCVAIASNIRIENPPVLQLQLVQTKDVQCSSDKTGWIQTTATGGTQPYQIRWRDGDNNPVGSTVRLENIPAGRYIGILADQNGCTDTLRVQIRAGLPAIVLPDSTIRITPVLCRGESNGTIRVQASGGLGPYQYQWSNGRSGNTLTQLPAGVYSVSITDQNQCTSVFGNLAIAQADEPLRVSGVIDRVRCAGESNGAIVLQVSGGNEPYNLVWERNGTFFAPNQYRLQNLTGGVYIARIEDANGCLRQTSFGIAEPSPLRLFIDSLPNGMLKALADGGVAPYRYQWSTGDTLETITPTYSGLFVVTVTDANQCQRSTGIVPTKSITNTLAIRVFPNPGSHFVWVETPQSGFVPLRWHLTDARGMTVQDGLFSPTPGQQKITWERALPTGLYYLLVHSRDGQSGFARLVIR